MGSLFGYKNLDIILVAAGLFVQVIDIVGVKLPFIYVLGFILAGCGLGLWARRVGRNVVLWPMLALLPLSGAIMALCVVIYERKASSTAKKARKVPLAVMIGVLLTFAMITVPLMWRDTNKILFVTTIHDINGIRRAVEAYRAENGRVVEGPDNRSVGVVYGIDISRQDRTYQVTSNGVIIGTFVVERRPLFGKDPLYLKTITLTPQNDFTSWKWGGTVDLPAFGLLKDQTAEK